MPTFQSFVKQTEINSSGGIRISVYKQTIGDDGSLLHEQPHQIMIMPLDNFDEIIARSNASLKKMGYPEIDPEELTLPRSLRDAAFAHPTIKYAIDQAQIYQDAVQEDYAITQKKLQEAEAEAKAQKTQEAEDGNGA